MFLNLSQLRSELSNALKNTTIGNERLTRWLNLGQDHIANKLDPDHLIVNTTFSTAVSTRKYYLEFEFNKIPTLINETQNQEMTQVTESELESLDPDRSTEGTPYLYSVYGIEWVQAQPTSASTISIVSTSASDTTQKVRVNGLVNGVSDTELITLNGTTTATGSKTFSEIFTISKNNTTTGKVTVSAGATSLATFGPAQLSRMFQPVHLWPTPGAVETIRVRGFRRPRPMVNEQDFPDFPEGYHEAVLHAGVIRGHRDLFRHAIADSIEMKVLNPMIDDLRRQMGNKRFKKSAVIQSSVPLYKGGRLGPQFGE